VLTAEKDYHVRAAHCEYLASDDEVYETLKRVTAPLSASWAKLERAERIAIKFNQDKRPDYRVRHEGQLQQLVSEKVGRSVLRLLRERTKAELVAVDVSFYSMYNGATIEETTTFAPLFEEFGVRYADGTQPPYKVCPVPGGGQMFARYVLPAEAVEADELVSVAVLKSHAFMGVTLALKNLFGLMPAEPHNHTRHYFHHLVRMPYMLADLGRIFNPALNIIDGLVGQAGREWGNGLDEGPAVTANTLIAGDHVIATDACAAHLMGHDPQSDWTTEPFHRDRNSLLVASEGGFGTVNLDEIDFQSEVSAPVGKYYAALTDPTETVFSWRRTTAEQGLFYRDNRKKLIDQYAGEYILLQQGEVRWHDTTSTLKKSRRLLAGDRKDEAMWLKLVDPEETEGEHYEVYEHALAQVNRLKNGALTG